MSFSLREAPECKECIICSINTDDGELDAFGEKRYESFNSDLGQKIRSGNASLSELADVAAKMRTCPTF